MEIGTHLDKYQRGTKLDMGDGAHLLAIAYGEDFYRDQEDLTAEYRSANGIAEGDPLPAFAVGRIFNKALLQTTIKGWGGYTLDGKPVEDKLEDGTLHAENGLLLLGPGGQGDAWYKAIGKLSGIEKAAEVAQEKNSLEPSPTN